MHQSIRAKVFTALLFICSLTVTAKQLDLSAFTTQKVNEHLYVMTQNYGDSSINFAVVIGEKSAVLITTMMKEYSAQVQALIDGVTNKPIEHVISIDGDYYHYYGSRHFVEKGATFVAHKNLIPDVFQDRILIEQPWQLDLGVEQIWVIPTNAHTQDHVMVKLEKSNVIFAGDALSFDWVVYSGPNGPDAHLNALAKMLEYGNLQTQYFPGNWLSKQSGNHLDVKALRNIYRTFSNKVNLLTQQGMKPEEIADSSELHQLFQPLSDYQRMKPHLIYFVNDVLGIEEG